MTVPSPRCLSAAVGLFLVAGCASPLCHPSDAAFQASAAMSTLPPADQSAPVPPTPEAVPDRPSEEPAAATDQLRVPPALPGAAVPPIRLPDTRAPRAERLAAIEKLFPPLPPLSPEPVPTPGPDDRPLTLADLQRIAVENSPQVRQAVAAVEVARGAALQAGLCPNPNVGYEGDTIGQGDTAGLQGAWIEQTIKTGGKLKLARAAALVDVANAELALRRARSDLATQVRSSYYAVLVAEKSIQVQRALVAFLDEAHRIQVEQVKAGTAVAYEPTTVRALTFQARAALTQARNRRAAAWQQLAAALGVPAMPPTALAGSSDAALPRFVHDKALARVLAAHTDVLTAQNSVHKAQLQLQLARVTPLPDVDVRLMVQKDFTTPPFNVVPSVVVGVPVPVWNRNQGGIREAEANLARAADEPERVRNDLKARLAEAFERYESYRALLEYYRAHILPDQVRAFRGQYEQYKADPEKVNFPDVVSAQQSLMGTVKDYLVVLGEQWRAVVDVANLLQANDLYAADEPCEVEGVVPVPELPPL